MGALTFRLLFCVLKHSLNSGDTTPGITGELAFPDSRDSPPLTPKIVRHAAIARLILSYFVSPLFSVCLWRHVLTAVMAVPEASVNKNDDFGLWPQEVRMSQQRLVPTPSGQSCISEQQSQTPLRRFVASATYAGHQLPARQTPKSGALRSSVTRPPAHRLIRFFVASRSLRAVKISFAANFA